MRTTQTHRTPSAKHVRPCPITVAPPLDATRASDVLPQPPPPHQFPPVLQQKARLRVALNPRSLTTRIIAPRTEQSSWTSSRLDWDTLCHESLSAHAHVRLDPAAVRHSTGSAAARLQFVQGQRVSGGPQSHTRGAAPRCTHLHSIQSSTTRKQCLRNTTGVARNGNNSVCTDRIYVLETRTVCQRPQQTRVRVGLNPHVRGRVPQGAGRLSLDIPWLCSTECWLVGWLAALLYVPGTG